MDVAIANGRVAEVSDHIDTAEHSLDVRGFYVTQD